MQPTVRNTFAGLLAALPLFILCASVQAQTGTIDRIRKACASETSVGKKAVLLNQLTWALYEAEADSCLPDARNALSYALRHRQWEQQLVAHLQLAEVARSEDQPALASSELQHAASLLNRHHATRYLPRLLLFKGNLAYDRNEPEKAERCYRKGYRLSKAAHSGLRIDCCLALARVEQQRGATGKALNDLREACSVAQQLGDYHSEILALTNLGTHYAMAQELDRAQSCFARSLQLSERLNDLPGTSRAYLNIGNIAYYKGNWASAVDCYMKSARLKERLNDLEGIAMIHNNIAAIYKEQKRYARSLEYYRKTAAYYETSGDSVLLAETWINEAIVGIFSGKREAGARLLHQSLRFLRTQNLPDLVLIAHTNLAFAYTEMGQYGRSLQYLKLAEQAADSLRDPHSMAFIANLYGADYFFLHNNREAIRYYTQSYELGKALGLLNEQKKALFGLYEAEQKSGNYRQALRWHELYTRVTDSLFNTESQQALTALQEQYDSQEKEREITQLNGRNKTISLESRLTANQLRLSLLSGALVVLGIIVLSLFFYYRSKRQQLLLARTQERNREGIDQLMREQEIVTLETAVRAQQSERKKLAKDIHDNLGSYLATLKYQHEAVQPAGDNPVLLSHYATTAKLIAEACAEVRTISHQMATGADFQFSLVPAVRELVNRIRTTARLRLQFYHFPDRLQLPREAELTLYKIIQEMLSNILKHAGATEVELQINQQDDLLTVLLEDNGCGFDPLAVGSKGLGLTSIRERVDQLGAKLEINSAPGKGTTLVLILPLIPSEP